MSTPKSMNEGNINVPKSMDEVINSLYGVLSYLKDHVGFNDEANAIESARGALMRKQDRAKCPKCQSKNVDLAFPTDDEMRQGAGAGGKCLDCGHEWQIEDPEPDLTDRDWDDYRYHDPEGAEDYPPDDDHPDSDPCATCNGQCERGFPCHAYGGCEP